MADDLRDRLAERMETLLGGTWCDQCYPSEWARTAVDAVLAELAGDPGDLRERMTTALRGHSLVTGGQPYGASTCTCGHWTGRLQDWTEHLADVAMSVRSEDAVAQGARLAQAEARAAHAEEAAVVNRERGDQWRRELARLREGEADDPGQPGTWPTAAQWIRRWNDLTPERRLELAGGAVDGMQRASVCRVQADHEGQINQLRAERDEQRRQLAQILGIDPCTEWGDMLDQVNEIRRERDTLTAEKTRADRAETTLAEVIEANDGLEELIRQLTAERDEARDERDAARLVSKGRTMEHYDAEAAIERVKALRGRSSMGRVNDYVPIADVRAALDGGE